MPYIIKGKKENTEKFFSKIPDELTDSWKLKSAEVTPTYNYYYLKKIKTPFCIQSTYQESYKGYDVKVSPTDAAKVSSYNDENVCLDLLSIFITDFELWASECHVTIEEINSLNIE